MPRVSVVVPVYNTSKYLRQCLDSLVNQTLEDIEIICVNDGSTDESADILIEYASKYPRIRIVSQSNKGYGAAMNHGFDEAGGEYIGIVESDDFADPNMFEELYAFAVRNNADVVKSDYYQYRDGISIPSKTFPLLTISEGSYNTYDFTDMFFEQRNWTGLYRRDFINSNGIRHNETKGASFQDVSFNYLVMCQAKTLFYLPQAFLHYRIDNPGSSIHSRNKTYALCDEMAYIEKYLDKYFSPNDKVYSVLANIRFRLYQRDAVHRIYPDDKYEFLERAIEEYSRDDGLGRYTNEYWMEEDWEKLQGILDNPDRYLRCVKNAINERIDQRSVFLSRIRSFPEVYVYGAGKVGNEVTRNLKNYGIEPDRVLVEDVASNPSACEGIIVCEFSDRGINREQAVVLVALREKLLDTVGSNLAANGYKNIIKMDCILRDLLRDYMEL